MRHVFFVALFHYHLVPYAPSPPQSPHGCPRARVPTPFRSAPSQRATVSQQAENRDVRALSV